MKFKQHILPWLILFCFTLLVIKLCQPSESTGYSITKNTTTPTKDSTQIIKEAQAYSNLKKSYDDIEQYHWYENSYFTHYINETNISLYIGLKQGSSNPFMRLKLSCKTDKVMGIEHIVLYYDGNTMDLPIDYFKERNFDNDGRVCWEWVDIIIKQNYISFIEKMAKGNDVRIRFKGSRFDKDYKVTQLEKQALEQVILGYNNFFN